MIRIGTGLANITDIDPRVLCFINKLRDIRGEDCSHSKLIKIYFHAVSEGSEKAEYNHKVPV